MQTRHMNEKAYMRKEHENRNDFQYIEIKFDYSIFMPPQTRLVSMKNEGINHSFRTKSATSEN